MVNFYIEILNHSIIDCEEFTPSCLYSVVDLDCNMIMVYTNRCYVIYDLATRSIDLSHYKEIRYDYRDKELYIYNVPIYHIRTAIKVTLKHLKAQGYLCPNCLMMNKKTIMKREAGLEICPFCTHCKKLPSTKHNTLVAR